MGRAGTAAWPPARHRHGIIHPGQLRLVMSQPLLDELRGLLFRPELQQRLPSLTPQHAAAILKKTLEFADWFPLVPARFSQPSHPKDDHLFNQAIESQASYLVTWESRLLKLRQADTTDAKRLRQLAPALTILNPMELAETLKPGR